MKNIIITSLVTVVLLFSVTYLVSSNLAHKAAETTGFTGAWKVTEANINYEKESPEDAVETSLFGNLFLTQTPLKIDQKGMTSFDSNGSMVDARFERQENQLRIYFTSGQATKNGMSVEIADSYAEFEITEGEKQFTLQRHDHLVKETYTFVKQ